MPVLTAVNHVEVLARFPRHFNRLHCPLGTSHCLNALPCCLLILASMGFLSLEGPILEREYICEANCSPKLNFGDRHVESNDSSAAQQDESSGLMTGMDDLSAEDSAVIQSFIDMLMPELDADTQDSGQGDTLGMHVICSGHVEIL